MSGDFDCRLGIFAEHGTKDGIDHVASPIKADQDSVHVGPKRLLFGPAEPAKGFLGQIVVIFSQAYADF
ncbi:hypothetical protein FJV80_24515 [Mesorhizobium sp. WSM4310]|nr:hypothetical protein FJV80_24515 [Mesorhizobium sp. WSM4310]